MSVFLLSLLLGFQILVALILAVVILLQSSDEDALSNINSGNAKFGAATKRSTLDSITKFTLGMGVLLLINSLLLAILTTRQHRKHSQVIKEYIQKQKQNTDTIPNTSN
jgi:protein translocase SecG subunit